MTADDVWGDIQSAFAHYGKKLSPKLRGERRRMIQKLIDEGYDREDLVAAVHGYVWFHNGMKSDANFDPRKYFKVDSVFRASKIDDRIDLGMRGPWRKPETPAERDARTHLDRVAEARREINQEQRGQLRAV